MSHDQRQPPSSSPGWSLTSSAPPAVTGLAAECTPGPEPALRGAAAGTGHHVHDDVEQELQPGSPGFTPARERNRHADRRGRRNGGDRDEHADQGVGPGLGQGHHAHDARPARPRRWSTRLGVLMKSATGRTPARNSAGAFPDPRTHRADQLGDGQQNVKARGLCLAAADDGLHLSHTGTVSRRSAPRSAASGGWPVSAVHPLHADHPGVIKAEVTQRPEHRVGRLVAHIELDLAAVRPASPPPASPRSGRQQRWPAYRPLPGDNRRAHWRRQAGDRRRHHPNPCSRITRRIELGPGVPV